MPPAVAEGPHAAKDFPRSGWGDGKAPGTRAAQSVGLSGLRDRDRAHRARQAAPLDGRVPEAVPLGRLE
jgi:hypothetical protein